ncbi:CopC domain-containing protein YobA [Trabulsiella odontotermitis]|uniref:CopC domain-containing protein YobA n=1 Tax=Trabulsiella odontotermitis TaxID=379893 RepID=UPI003ACF1CC0
MGSTTSRLLQTSALLVSLLTTTGALAHAHLKNQSPAADRQAPETPRELTLTFSEGVEANFSGLTLTGPAQVKVATGPATVNGKNNTQLVVPLEQPLASGNYTVDWHVVSVDGHKTKGQYHFSVK